MIKKESDERKKGGERGRERERGEGDQSILLRSPMREVIP